MSYNFTFTISAPGFVAHELAQIIADALAAHGGADADVREIVPGLVATFEAESERLYFADMLAAYNEQSAEEYGAEDPYIPVTDLNNSAFQMWLGYSSQINPKDRSER